MIAHAGRRVALATALAAVLSGCSVGLEQLPAPSGTQGATYGVTAQFGDVQNLAEGAKVKLGGVVVGVVTSITTQDYVASVHLSLEKKIPLGRDVHLQIRFTTPLGEDFVSVTSAGHPRVARLHAGSVVPLRDTSDAPNIEDTFAAVSTLLNGGGLDKLQVIARELDETFKGRTSPARDALIKLDRVVANLDVNKGAIDRVLDGLARLGTTLRASTGTIQQALDLFPATLSTLADDTARVRDLLQRVGRLGDTVHDVLQRSQNALLSDLDNLRPTLDSLRARQDELIPTFDSLIKVGRLIQRAAPGDYLNVSGTIQFLLDAKPARPQPGGVVHPGSESGDAAVAELLTGGLR